MLHFNYSLAKVIAINEAIALSLNTSDRIGERGWCYLWRVRCTISLGLNRNEQFVEPSDAQYLIIIALQTLGLLTYNTYERDRGLWFIATLSTVLPVAVITQDGEIYPIEWVQGDDNN